MTYFRSPAPVALFVYARPEHTRRTLDALARSHGAAETDIVVYADGARGLDDHKRVVATREIARRTNGFRSVTVVEREDNFGLARNLVQGITDSIQENGRLIVIEDDIVPAYGFLDYMNAALQQYENEPCVWHISGWNYPIDPTGLPPYFFWQVMNCWGWATWADRWAYYQRNPKALVGRWTKKEKRAFNLEGDHDFFSQIEDNAAGRIRTWAVFWYASIFEHGGLCLNPTTSFVQNIGLDGTGENCGVGETQTFDQNRQFGDQLPTDIMVDVEAVARIRQHLRNPKFWRLMVKALHRI